MGEAMQNGETGPIRIHSENASLLVCASKPLCAVKDPVRSLNESRWIREPARIYRVPLEVQDRRVTGAIRVKLEQKPRTIGATQKCRAVQCPVSPLNQSGIGLFSIIPARKGVKHALV